MTFLAPKKCQLEPLWDFTSPQSEWLCPRKQMLVRTRERETLFISGGNGKCTGTMEASMEPSQNTENRTTVGLSYITLEYTQRTQYSYRDTCILVFTVALFIKAEEWNVLLQRGDIHTYKYMYMYIGMCVSNVWIFTDTYHV